MAAACSHRDPVCFFGTYAGQRTLDAVSDETLLHASGFWRICAALVFCGITAGVFAVLSGNVYSLVLALPCEQETAYRKKAYCVVCDLDSGFELWCWSVI